MLDGNKAYGALFGAAVGDALGAPLEFMSPRTEQNFVKDYVGGGVLRHKPGDTTDDTQMAIGIMKMYQDHGEYNQEAIIGNWLNWLNSNPKDIGNWTHKVLSSWKRSTRFDLRGEDNPAVKIWKISRSNAGNGAVMRCMPTAVFRANNPQKMIEETILLAEDTHPDPRCILSCLCVNQLISEGIRGKTKEEAYEDAIRDFSEVNREFANTLKESRNLPWYEWNNGGFTIDTVKCAVAAWIQYDDVEEGMIRVVNRGNDADSVGAVAGALFGSYNGVTAIPRRWLNFRDRNEIEKFAEFAIRQW